VKNGLALFYSTPKVHPSNKTLMSQVVADKSISRDSDTYQTALSYFDKNLEAIIQLAANADAKVIVSTLVSNLGDQEPFGWHLSAKLTTVQQQRWHQYMEQAITLEKAGQYNEALEFLFRAEKIDSGPAILFYYRARCLQGVGNPSTAKAEYEKARDADLIRFRAGSDFNEVIRDVCRRTSTPCIEMEPVLAPYCPDQILDRNVFTDHLHPSFAGYFWMAKAFVEEMQRIGCVDRPRRWETARNLSTRDYRRLAGVTDLELMIASYRIEKLTGSWPFQEKTVLMPPKSTEYDSLLRRVVDDLFARKFGWKTAHFQIAQYLEKNKRYDEAAAEYEAVIKVMPFNYAPYIELANMKTGLKYSPGLPHCYAKLGFLYYFTGRSAQAIEKMHQAIEINQRENQFNKNELSGAYHILALAYGKEGNYEMGIRAARSALTAEPESKDAATTLNQLEMALAGKRGRNLSEEE
jgi:tetratricopeptide (TPR) repeat protein